MIEHGSKSQSNIRVLRTRDWKQPTTAIKCRAICMTMVLLKQLPRMLSPTSLKIVKKSIMSELVNFEKQLKPMISCKTVHCYRKIYITYLNFIKISNETTDDNVAVSSCWIKQTDRQRGSETGAGV